MEAVVGELGRRGLGGRIQPSVFALTSRSRAGTAEKIADLQQAKLRSRLRFEYGFHLRVEPSEDPRAWAFFIVVRAILLLEGPFFSIFSQMLAQCMGLRYW